MVGELMDFLLFWWQGNLFSWLSDLPLGGQMLIQWLGRVGAA